MPTEFLTKAEACDLLRISPPTLARLNQTGRLPFVKVGRHCVRILASDVVTFITHSKKVGSTNE